MSSWRQLFVCAVALVYYLGVVWAGVVASDESGDEAPEQTGFRYEVTYSPKDCTKRTNTGDFLQKHYTVWIGNKDGVKVDSSFDRGHTFDFRLGLGEVIKGMDMAMRGVCKGEKRSITLPPHLAYGNHEREKIPAGSTLYFEVELVDFTSSGYTQEVTQFAEGCKRRTKAGDEILEHYNGTFEDGTPFDSSYSRNEPYSFTLGNREVIRGVDMGLLNMCVGERRKLVIPAVLAYGDKGYRDIIPPGATLIFSVELMEIVGGTFKMSKIDGPKCDRKAQKGDSVTVHHHTFVDGKKGATSSYDADIPLKFVIGDGSLMEGVHKGVEGMCISERRRLQIPPEQAYQTDEGDFPAHTHLTMDVELIDFEAPDLFKLCDTDQDGWVFHDEFVDYMITTDEFKDIEESEATKVLEERFIDLDINDPDQHLCRHEFYRIPHHHRDEL